MENTAGVHLSEGQAQPCSSQKPGGAAGSSVVFYEHTRSLWVPCAAPASPDGKQERSGCCCILQTLPGAELLIPVPVFPLGSQQEPAQPDQSAKYYHLTHDELIQLLLQKEGELSKKEEHIQELENYIDQLLVRIMEQSPTLLQIPLGQGQAP